MNTTCSYWSPCKYCVRLKAFRMGFYTIIIAVAVGGVIIITIIITSQAGNLT